MLRPQDMNSVATADHPMDRYGNEPARADVMGMAQDPAKRRCLATNFTLLGHSRCLGCGPRTALEHPSMPHQLGQNQMGALSRLTGTVSGDTGTV